MRQMINFYSPQMVATKNIHNSCADHGWLVSEAKVLMKKDKAETFLNGRSSTIRRAGDHNYIVPYFRHTRFLDWRQNVSLCFDRCVWTIS